MLIQHLVKIDELEACAIFRQISTGPNLHRNSVSDLLARRKLFPSGEGLRCAGRRQKDG